MSQTMCPDPYPMCPQRECGYPISGCRSFGCVDAKCRNNHRVQGVELKYRPPSEFEFHEKFDTQEMPWRPSRGVASPIYGYEVPFKPSRHFFPADSITQPTLKCNAIPTKEQPWRAQRKTFPTQTGALSGDDSIRHRKYLVPMVIIDDGKPSKGAENLAASRRFVSECSSAEKDWKPARHVSGMSGCETTQPEFHPHRRHIFKGGSTNTIRHPKKAPGVYKREDGEWLPPFRAPTPEMVTHQTTECLLWLQCPQKKTGKKAAPQCARRQGEWQPDFRTGVAATASAMPGEGEEQRPSSRQGLKHCQCRPDEWCPPWKQQPRQQFGQIQFHPQQQHTDNVDISDSMLQRNATINEDANCTHYLDADESNGLGLPLEQQAGVESTEEEDNGDGDGDDGQDDEDYEAGDGTLETPAQNAVNEYYLSACDGCDELQSGGAGKEPRTTNTCCSAEEDT